MVKLEDWAVTYATIDPYTPPERLGAVLTGKCYGHPKHADGTIIRTSQIVRASGKFVRTLNTAYELGTPSKAYLDWLAEHSYNYNPESPVGTN